MTRVGVIGAAGRMGSQTCAAVRSDPDLELVCEIRRGDDLGALVESGAEVAVDFTTPEAVKDNVLYCLGRRIPVVVGTTGLSEADIAEIRAAAGDTGVVIAPNFAIGAVLMMRFAAEASPYFDVAEIVERHHEAKRDAPSGTALRTAELMSDRRGRPWETTPGAESLAGVRGGDAGGVRIHSLRTPGSVAHQEVILGGAGQTLTIRHDSLDRSSYMPGVLLAVKRVRSLSGVVVGLENLLEL